MKAIGKIPQRSFISKRWMNESGVCDRRRHPVSVYRPYRRGKNRCLECGARIGKFKMSRKSFLDSIAENILKPSPLLEMLRK